MVPGNLRSEGWRAGVARLGLEAESGFPWGRNRQQCNNRDSGAG